VGHGGMAFTHMHEFLKNWYSRSATCPACRTTFKLNGSARSSIDKESPIPGSPVANEQGMSEGDRLITVADNEA
jgi:hypothetical protein